MLEMNVSRTQIALVLWALLGAVACGSTKGTVSLVNRAEEPISRATIDVAGQTLEITNLGPSETATRTFRVTKDSHYTVEVVFRSGKRLKKDDGYVTPGFDFDDRIVVTESTLELQSTHRRVEEP
jgi:hypothetical protein